MDNLFSLLRPARRLAALALLFTAFSAAHAQPADEDSGRDLTPGPWEVTAQVSYLSSWLPLVAGSRGVSLRAGYRPTASRRGLVEVYGLHVPPDAGAFSSAPQVNALGVMGTFLARKASRRINPYIAGGLGLWHVDTKPPCRDCFEQDPRWFEDTTAVAAAVGAGLYVTVLPALALRADAKIHGPLALGGDRGSPHPVFLMGVSVRL